MSGSTEGLETNDLDVGHLKMRRTSAAENSKGWIVNTKNASESPIRIYLLAQNRLVREVLVRMFRKRTDLTVVGVNHDSAGAIAELTELSQVETIFGIFAVIFVVKSCVSIVEL